LKNQLESNIVGDYWQRLEFRIGVEGNHWIGTADNYGVPPGPLFDAVGEFNDALTGELLSKPFNIDSDYITFLIGGMADLDQLRVELLVATDPGDPGPIVIGNDRFRVDQKSTGHGRELMRRAWFNCDSFGHHVKGRKARIQIVDHSNAGHLNVDDFQFVNEHPIGMRVKIGSTNYPALVTFDGHYYDWDSPVWGFTDMHTHPMSHLGFAGKVMHGEPDGGPLDPLNPALALGDCRCTHGGWYPGNECGDLLRQAMMMAMDDKGNETHRDGWTSTSKDGIEGANFEDYARFRYWPVFSTISHQQMWHEWTKRAYDGGLRVMVALCVNNGLLGSASKGEGPIDDMTVGNNQIRALTNFVARHDDFMEIALDPFQLRDILRRNKLAIIIGSELDDIGNFALNRSIFEGNDELDPSEADKTKVRSEIQRLHDLGLRYIFPVHLMNNKFGGTPIVSPMLNMASKFLNGQPLYVVPAGPEEHITYWLPERFDVLEELQKHDLEIGSALALLPVLAPFIPIMADTIGGVPGLSGGLLPLAMMASVGLAGEFGEVVKAIPPDVWPIGNNYPTYPGKGPGEAPWGHKNARGLTKMGQFAVTEMMKRGMMLDVDHMGQRTIDEVFSIAEQNPVGYPLNSGHNSFRDQAKEHRTENHRTGEQMARIRQLGGLFGVGYENSSQYSVVSQRQSTYSQVDNDCGGTSKTVSQIYLQALEYMEGHNVALGTDINGLIAGPGPRFGPNSSFATKSPWHLEELIRSQRNGVRYEPLHGRPIVGPAFQGHGVDPGQEFGWGRDQYLDNGNLHYGYTYSQEQRDFFAAIRIFYYFKEKVSDGMTLSAIDTELDKIGNALSGGYNQGRIVQFARGLLKGIKGWPITDQIIPNIDMPGTREWLGRRVFQLEVVESDVYQQLDDLLHVRLSALRGVWGDYHQVFGSNTPLKRSKTGPKDWDINFDGVAHYGLLPDLFQDMSNVGLERYDLSPLFQSGDDFAVMWTRCLNAADALNHPLLTITLRQSFIGKYVTIEWFGFPGDQLQQSDYMGSAANWTPSPATVQFQNGRAKASIALGPDAKNCFFRVRKP
jgi:microsomal dipeptidase-like Zn-dependent dipeptidase